MPQWTYASIFFCAIRLSRRLYSSKQGFPRAVPATVEYVLEHLQATRGKYIPIIFHPKTYEANAFFGTIEDSNSKVDIYYDRNRNTCWRRFIITKELCHLLYDSPNNQHLTSSPEQIGTLLRQILAGLVEVDFQKDHAASSEQATILMAIEILLPHRERANVDKMIANGGNALSIAKHYVLPEQMVSFYLDKSYATSMDKATKDFEAQDK